MKKVMKGILIVVGVIFILFCILVGYIIVDTNKQEKLLESEVQELLKLDLTKDEVNTELVTRDEYAIIENAMKKYLKDYSEHCKSYIEAIDTFDFANMFTATTFQNDGPDFVNSKGKLSQLKDRLNTHLDKLIEMGSEEYIVGLVQEKGIDEYYADLYREYMLGNQVYSFNDTLESDMDDVKKVNDEFNLFLDDCYSLYDFMSKNRNDWSVEGEIVYFTTNELVNEYNAILNKIIMDSDNLAKYESDNSDNSGGVGSV